MIDGFIKVAAITPKLILANASENAKKIAGEAQKAAECGAKIIVFPELSLCGHSLSDLFFNQELIESCLNQIPYILKESEDIDALIFMGLPYAKGGKLYNCALAINHGRPLAIIPKKYIPNYGEFYEKRHFEEAPLKMEYVELFTQEVPFGNNVLFCCQAIPSLMIGCELCEDLWAASPPSTDLARGGATLIVNLSASPEGIGKRQYRRLLVKSQSARLLCGYVYANAGLGESSTDLVYGGHSIIAEYGKILAESTPFEGGTIYSEIDVQRLISERRKNTSFKETESLLKVDFTIECELTKLTREIPRTPFVPKGKSELGEHAKEILDIQANGLARRISHIGAEKLVLGISGGLDSSLALLVCERALSLLGRPAGDILAVTMPCFGTTERTRSNAEALAKAIGAQFREIDITKAVRQHFVDIGHDEAVHDVTYENSQARERTQILMDIANKEGGLVIGTGDMSELALGWATYGGDHMSMYGVNAHVPKTLVKHLISYAADARGGEIKSVLEDVLNTPISPELLPAKDGEISQKTEELVGPYELNDFFLYYFLRMSFSPRKIYRLALYAFDGQCSKAEIKKWLEIFVKRFFTQQFKRSCLPDGPKVGTVALSPRGDLRMPSDADFSQFTDF